MANVDAIGTQAIEPWPLAVGRLALLHGFMMRTQGLRAVHRCETLGEGSESRVEQSLQRQTRPGDLSERRMRAFELRLEALDRSQKVSVFRNRRDNEALRIRTCCLRLQQVEGVLQAACEPLVVADGIEEWRVVRFRTFQTNVQRLLTERVVRKSRLQLPEGTEGSKRALTRVVEQLVQASSLACATRTRREGTRKRIPFLGSPSRFGACGALPEATGD